MKDIIRKLKKLLTLMPIKVYRDAIFYGVAAAIEHEELLCNKTYKTVVDIGANKGQFSLVARKTYPYASIYSFDPLDSAKATFKKVFYNDVNTHFFNYAIGP